MLRSQSISRIVTRFLEGSTLSIALVFSSAPAHAQFAGLRPPFFSGTAEAWAGADATRNAWSSYTGFNWAPFGKLVDAGWRMRLAGGYGEYRYEGGRPRQSIYGSAAFADLLVGYQMAFGDLTLKAFAGATFDGHLLAPFDETNPVNGSATGAKAVVESWLNLSPSAWLQVDGAYGTAHAGYTTRVRIGWRAMHSISLGVEGGAFGNEASRSSRGGAFVRYEWLAGELSVSGGVSGDIAEPRNPYGTFVYLTRF